MCEIMVANKMIDHVQGVVLQVVGQCPLDLARLIVDRKCHVERLRLRVARKLTTRLLLVLTPWWVACTLAAVFYV